MIPRGSWRRIDSQPVEQGAVGAAAQLLLTTDGASVTVLHLGPGGHTDRASENFGQLLVIIDGGAVTEVGNEQTSLRVGDVVRWPPGVPHRLRSDDGVSALVVAYPEAQRSWRVVKVDGEGKRWVVGVFGDTDRARKERDRLRARAAAGEQVVLE